VESLSHLHLNLPLESSREILPAQKKGAGPPHLLILNSVTLQEVILKQVLSAEVAAMQEELVDMECIKLKRVMKDKKNVIRHPEQKKAPPQEVST
jgi:hypothetical protein